MVKIVNGMNAKDHVGEIITCPDCGGKLRALDEHPWCGARNNDFEKCKLKNGKIKNNGLSEYANAYSITKWCREHGRCNHDLDDKMVAPHWRHIGDKEIYKYCSYYIPVYKEILDLREKFMDYIGDKYITWNLENPEKVGQRVIDNYGFCINIRSFEELYEGYEDDLIYIMDYEKFDKYKETTHKSLFRRYSDKEGYMLFLKRDKISSEVEGYVINRHNIKTGKYKFFPLINFEHFLNKFKLSGIL